LPLLKFQPSYLKKTHTSGQTRFPPVCVHSSRPREDAHHNRAKVQHYAKKVHH